MGLNLSIYQQYRLLHTEGVIYKPNGKHKSKLVTDMQEIKIKESKFITKEIQQIVREQDKKRTENYKNH